MEQQVVTDLSPTAIGLLTMASFVVWSTVYGLLCLFQPRRSYEWNCRIVVFIHAITVITLSSTFGFLYNPWPFTDPGGQSNIYEISTMIVCLGYFLFDFCWCVWFYDQDTRIMIVHHLVSIVGIAVSLVSGLSGTEIGTCIFLAEVTNPLLQMRWFMRSSGIKEGVLYEINDFMFLVTFAVCRIGIGSFFLYRHCTHPLPKLFFKIGGVALYTVGVVFMVQLLAFAYHKYTGMYRRWKTKGSTHLSVQENKQN